MEPSEIGDTIEVSSFTFFKANTGPNANTIQLQTGPRRSIKRIRCVRRPISELQPIQPKPVPLKAKPRPFTMEKPKTSKMREPEPPGAEPHSAEPLSAEPPGKRRRRRAEIDITNKGGIVTRSKLNEKLNKGTKPKQNKIAKVKQDKVTKSKQNKDAKGYNGSPKDTIVVGASTGRRTIIKSFAGSTGPVTNTSFAQPISTFTPSTIATATNSAARNTAEGNSGIPSNGPIATSDGSVIDKTSFASDIDNDDRMNFSYFAIPSGSAYNTHSSSDVPRANHNDWVLNYNSNDLALSLAYLRGVSQNRGHETDSDTHEGFVPSESETAIHEERLPEHHPFAGPYQEAAVEDDSLDNPDILDDSDSFRRANWTFEETQPPEEAPPRFILPSWARELGGYYH
ncbi:MAG: hypothetical protein M1839_009609 [Geoglossum umbratile]|nr:MAG: hypothetical protein M1839_009609 [Geoglossum umbratile]